MGAGRQGRPAGAAGPERVKRTQFGGVKCAKRTQFPPRRPPGRLIIPLFQDSNVPTAGPGASVRNKANRRRSFKWKVSGLKLETRTPLMGKMPMLRGHRKTCPNDEFDAAEPAGCWGKQENVRPNVNVNLCLVRAKKNHEKICEKSQIGWTGESAPASAKCGFFRTTVTGVFC
jgi:hypothetical protein